MRCVALATTHAAGAPAGAELVVPSLAGLRVDVDRAPDGGPAFAIAPGARSGAPGA